jgi:hypothetical protein
MPKRPKRRERGERERPQAPKARSRDLLLAHQAEPLPERCQANAKLRGQRAVSTHMMDTLTQTSTVTRPSQLLFLFYANLSKIACLSIRRTCIYFSVAFVATTTRIMTKIYCAASTASPYRCSSTHWPPTHALRHGISVRTANSGSSRPVGLLRLLQPPRL